MIDSILSSIKKLLNVPIEYENFDNDIIMHINSVFTVLTQLGVGPSEGFMITDNSTTWDQFLPDNQKNLNLVITYVYFKVKLMFDPPTSSSVMESMNRQINEFEWRLNTAVETITDG